MRRQYETLCNSIVSMNRKRNNALAPLHFCFAQNKQDQEHYSNQEFIHKDKLTNLFATASIMWNWPQKGLKVLP